MTSLQQHIQTRVILALKKIPQERRNLKVYNVYQEAHVHDPQKTKSQAYT